MRIIISSLTLKRIIDSFTYKKLKITKWRMMNLGLEFYDEISGKWKFMNCHTDVSTRAQISESDYNVEFTFNPDQWKKMSTALTFFPEQPIVMRLANSAEEILNGDTNISIEQCILIFN